MYHHHHNPISPRGIHHILKIKQLLNLLLNIRQLLNLLLNIRKQLNLLLNIRQLLSLSLNIIWLLLLFVCLEYTTYMSNFVCFMNSTVFFCSYFDPLNLSSSDVSLSQPQSFVYRAILKNVVCCLSSCSCGCIIQFEFWLHVEPLVLSQKTCSERLKS